MNLYKNYMSLIYAANDRKKYFYKEYSNMFYWNKKYINEYISKDINSNILDIGCGLGQNLYFFKKMGFKNILGIDKSQECYEFCKKNNFQVKKISAEFFLKNKKNFYDTITIYHVVEHINKHKIINFLKLIRNSLKPGGKLIINMPNGNNIINGIADRYVDITHEILYTPNSLKEILIASGFNKKNIIIKEVVAYSPNDTQILRKIIKKIFLPILTIIVDFIWFIFFLSQGSNLKKNRPVLLSISTK